MSNLQPTDNSKNSPIPKSNSIKDYLKNFHKILSNGEKCYFAIKNNQLKKILNECDIPTFDLENLNNIPSIKEMEQSNGKSLICSNHLISKIRRYRCAYRKCLLLWKYLKSNDV